MHPCLLFSKMYPRIYIAYIFDYNGLPFTQMSPFMKLINTSLLYNAVICSRADSLHVLITHAIPSR